MAKKDGKNELESSDLDDLDFDIPELDIDPENDDRSPVTKLSTGFAQGVKDDLSDQRDIPRKLKAALPPTYTSTIDLADQTVSTAGNLYNSLRDETRDGVKSIKRVARQALGKHDSKMPDWLSERLNGLVGEEETERRQPTVADQRDEQIENTLANVFSLQAKQNVERGEEEDRDQAVRDALQGKRHESRVDQLYGIRQAVERQVDYQDQVTARYQRKSLEMQYRQYFMTRDLFKVNEESARDIKEGLQVIAKNTALPDYRKLELTEAAGGQLRDRLIGGAQDKMRELTSGFFSRASQSITERFREKAQGWGDQLQQMAGQGEMMMGAGDSMDSMELGGSMAGGAASGYVGNKILFPLLRHMGLQNEQIRETGEDLRDGVEGLPREVNEWVKENQGNTGIMGFLADAIGSRGLESGVEIDGMESLQDPSYFDRQTRQSIVEVIPGLLSHIHNELRWFRSGMGIDDPDPNGRLVYNQKDRKLTSRQREQETIQDQIFNPDDLVSAFDRFNDTIDSLDIGDYTGGEDAEEIRSELARYLMKESLDGRSLDLERLSNADSFGEDVSAKTANTIADAVQTRYNTRRETDEFGHESFQYDNTRENKDRLRNTRRLFGEMSDDVKDPQNTIQAVLQMGGEEHLNDLGLLKYDRSGKPTINYDKVFDVIERGGYGEKEGTDRHNRREERRYDRYFEQADLARNAREERERGEERQREKESGWLGSKVKGVKDRTGRATRDLEQRVGLSDDPRYRTVERAGVSNRKLTPELREKYEEELARNKRREERFKRAGRMVRSREGRRHAMDQAGERVSGTVEHYKDADNRRETFDLAKDKLSRGAGKLRGQSGDLAKKLSETQTFQKAENNERVQSTLSRGKETHRISEIHLIVRNALRLFDPRKRLSKQAREALKTQLRMELETGGEIQVDALTNPETYLDDVASRTRQELAEHFVALLESEDFDSSETPANLKDLIEGKVAGFKESKHVQTARDTASKVRDATTDTLQRYESHGEQTRGEFLKDEWEKTKDSTKSSSVVKNARERLSDVEGEVRNRANSTRDALSKRFKGRKQDGVVDLTQDGDEDLNVTWEDNPELGGKLKGLKKSLSRGRTDEFTHKTPESEDDPKGNLSGKISSVSTNPLTMLLSELAWKGRDRWTDTAKKGEQTSLSKLSRQLDKLTQLFGRKDDVQSYESLERGHTDSVGVDAGVDIHHHPVSPVDDARGVSRDTAGTTPSTFTSAEEVDGMQTRSLMTVFRDVKAILRGDDEGVGQDVRQLVERLDTSHDADPERAQVAVLSRILETVEAIGQHLTKDDEESWFNILDIGKKTGRVMAKTAGALGNFYLGGLKMAGGGMSGIGRALAGTGRGAGSLMRRMLTPGAGKLGATDVYLKGNPEPIMRATEMKEGAYVDAETGDPIKTVDDLYRLKGDVVDHEGNLVATAAELARGIYDRFGDRIGGRSLLSHLGGVGSAAWNYFTAPTRMLLKAPKLAWDAGSSIINRVRDVYVRGEKNPRLMATVMKNGGYISATTGRPIYKLSDIDGEVRDRQGNVVLSLEDMRLGLVDWKGEPIKFLDRQLKRVMSLASVPLKVGGWALGKARDVAGWARDQVSAVAGGLKNGIHIGGSQRTAERDNEQLSALHAIRNSIDQQTQIQSREGEDRHGTLKEIRRLIQQQIDGQAKRRWDTDDDGHRDGSWRSQLAANDVDGGTETTEVEQEKKGNPVLDLLKKLALPAFMVIKDLVGGAMGYLKDLLFKIAEMIGLKKLTDGFRSGGGGDRSRGGSRSGGKLARAGRWLWEGAKSAGRSLASKGPAVKAALRTGGSWIARQGLWQGARTAAVAGAGVLAGVSAPVWGSIAAVGAVAGLGYLAWRKYKGKDLGGLGDFRMRQYGLTDKDEMAKVRFMENALINHVSIDHKTGKATLDQRGVDFEALHEELGIDTTDEEAVTRFGQWLNLRFLPVFAAAVAGLREETDEDDIDQIDNLRDEVKKSFFDRATKVGPASEQYPHPYAFPRGPFGSLVETTIEGIRAEEKRLKEELKKKAEKAERRVEAPKQNRYVESSPTLSGMRIGHNNRLSGTLRPEGVDDTTRERIAALRRDSKVATLQGKETRIQGTLLSLTRNTETDNEVSAADVILLKAWGLTKLNPNKVELLLSLKDEMLKQVSYTSKDGLAVWDGKVDSVLGDWRSRFGIGWWELGMKGDWKKWFKHRFMKVLLGWLTAIKGDASRPDMAEKLKEGNYALQLQAAERVVAMEFPVSGEPTSIWDLTDSPWEDYTLNADPTSTHPFLAYLRKRANAKASEGEKEEVSVRGLSSSEVKSTNDSDRSAQRETQAEVEGKRRDRVQQSRKGSTATTEPSVSKGRGPVNTDPTSGTTGTSNNSGGGGDGEMMDVSGGPHTPVKVPKNDGYKAILTGMSEAGIKDPEEQAMVLAQLGHESANFTAVEENLNYGESALRRVFSKYFPTRQTQKAYARKPEAIATKAYGGRMGNNTTGEGWKYRGRGYIQMTGKNNYIAASKALGYDYVNNPDLVSEPEHAARVSLWWWKNRAGLREAAQRGDVNTSTEKINGGTNGLSDRVNRYKQAIQRALNGEINEEMEDFSATEAPEEPMAETAENGGGGAADLTEEGDDEVSVEKPVSNAQSLALNRPDSAGTDVKDDGSEVKVDTRTARQVVSGAPSIDSSAGIDQALDRNPDQVKKRQTQKRQQAQVQDEQEREQHVAQGNTMAAVQKILQDSLSTQRSMDGRLKTVVELLGEGNRGGDRVTPDQDNSEAVRDEQRQKRNSTVDFDPRDVNRPTLSVKRRRSM